jgi:hypothetical protein
MNEIKLNGKTYILKSSVKSNADLKAEILSLQARLKTKNDDYVNNKYKNKYEELNKKYRSLYMQYKNQSDRMSQNRQKYLAIIHKLQCEIINQASIEDLLKEVERMSEIEAQIN